MAQERVGAIVAGAGSGRRLGGVEKAFMLLGGRPLIAYSIDVFEAVSEIDEIVLVVGPERIQAGEALVAESEWRKVTAVVAGGAERQDSVRAGVEALRECAWLLVHDAARPLVTGDLVRDGIEAAKRHGAAVAATPVRDTLKRATSRSGDWIVAETVDRTGLWAAQTPQVFRAGVLRGAYARLWADAARYTDDAALVQAAGHTVALFDGDPGNIKITLPGDVALAEAALAARRTAPGGGAGVAAAEHGGALTLRAGTGYDIHRLVAGRALVLGGTTVPFERGLAGHSDGDALAHAVTDALLGACGLPDIGRQFPPGDPRYQGIDSVHLLTLAARLARNAGWMTANVDATVICEQPRLSPHVDQMRTNLARALGVDPAVVMVKAKTNEGLDSVGRGEAVAAHAIILVKRTAA